jgi:hypothetical protein
MTEEPTDEEIEKMLKELGIGDDPQGAEGIGDFLFLLLADSKTKEEPK